MSQVLDDYAALEHEREGLLRRPGMQEAATGPPPGFLASLAVKKRGVEKGDFSGSEARRGETAEEARNAGGRNRASSSLPGLLSGQEARRRTAEVIHELVLHAYPALDRAADEPVAAIGPQAVAPGGRIEGNAPERSAHAAGTGWLPQAVAQLDPLRFGAPNVAAGGSAQGTRAAIGPQAVPQLAAAASVGSGHPGDGPSTGLVLCQDKKDILAEYALRGMNKPIGVSAYELTRALPESLASALPTIEAIEAELTGDVDEGTGACHDHNADEDEED